jgi:hypothetical protein
MHLAQEGGVAGSVARCGVTCERSPGPNAEIVDRVVERERNAG